MTTGFRWLLQEDTTLPVSPGVTSTSSLAVSFHASYAPVLSTGSVPAGTDTALIPIPDSSKRYFLSVLPDSGHGMSGAPLAAGQTTATVVVQEHPIPTAQFSVLVYEDHSPINGFADLPQERGLAGFKVIVEDAGGRYGATGTQQMTDAFGNPIGTTYNDDGSVKTPGDGVVTTNSDGYAFVKCLAPGKYGVRVIPPDVDAKNFPADPGLPRVARRVSWVQTSTIEGTKTQDVWIKPNEPQFMVEFGPPGTHVSIGFVEKDVVAEQSAAFLDGTGVIHGRATNLHMSRPPIYTFSPGPPVPAAWVALNTAGGTGAPAARGLFAGPCDQDSNFEIANLPNGTYDLVLFDANLDMIIGTRSVTIPDPISGETNIDLGDVPVFDWFGHLYTRVFDDRNQNGFRDPGEPGIPEQTVNVRFRDGTIYQSFTTDPDGFLPFDETFPFFNWMVAEVDYTRFKATGVTIVVDDGGVIPPDNGWAMPSLDRLNPQPQFEVNPDGSFVLDGGGNKVPAINPNTGNNLSRTETQPAPVLLEAFQLFAGATTVMEFGKAPYDSGETGLLSGIVYYATTRAEDDPTFAAAELWERGIPRVQVNLYEDQNGDGIIDDGDGDLLVTLADVDNYPLDNFPGTEDVDRNHNGLFDTGDAIQVVHSDSWDDNLPSGTQGERFVTYGTEKDGFDGLRNYNQVRPGVFDGGYGFSDVLPGTYIVEAVPPPGYELQKEEDKNVDFGDVFACDGIVGEGPGHPLADLAGGAPGAPAPGPTPDLRPKKLVGDLHLVPEFLKLFTEQQVPCKYAGQMRPLPDRKQVVVAPKINAACDFFLFTEVPIAGQIVGFVLDDNANEFDPNAPNFGEKFAPPWLPVSVRDWKGNVISRGSTDQWGAYNLLVPSTYTAATPLPSGMTPNMLTVVINDASPVPNPDYVDGDPTSPRFLPNPFFNRKYSQFTYTFMYMPGTTTYLDTPVVPLGAFAGRDQFPVDCEPSEGTPVIYSVSGPSGGPYVPSPGSAITIASVGVVEVPNPAYGAPGEAAVVQRDHGFGPLPGTVTVGGVPLTITAWSSGAISALVPVGAHTGELSVTRGDNGRSSEMGVTVVVGLAGGSVHMVSPASGGNATPIQDAVDLAQPGDLVLVAPGRYDELVILWKPVQLQGWGAASTIINAVQSPAERVGAWRSKIESLWTGGFIDLLPSQELLFGTLEPAMLLNEGAAISVFGKNASQGAGGFGPDPRPRIDGFTLTGASTGGGLFVNGYAPYLEIANNRVIGNAGTFGGGIIVGHPDLTVETLDGLDYDDCRSDHLLIHHNLVSGNSALAGAGGGLSFYTGADDYEVTQNAICGNFTNGNGAGIGQQGRCDNASIRLNTILFNQGFDQGPGVTLLGGGVCVSGGAPLVPGGLSPGAGSISIEGNLIQGNQSGAGDGGGISLASVNGQDVARNLLDPDVWYTANVQNNVIVNNMAGLSGGGVSLQDVVRATIAHNTIANNDSTATVEAAFPASIPSQVTYSSEPQPAGLSSRGHSPDFALAVASSLLPSTYSDPVLDSNIIWHNRSFAFTITIDNSTVPPGSTYGLVPDLSVIGVEPVYWDLEVIGPPGSLDPRNGILTDILGYDPSNISTDPEFLSPYVNADSGQTFLQPEFTTGIQAQPAFDEGGNFIDVRFGPLARYHPETNEVGAGPPVLIGDYHIDAGSQAIGLGSPGVRPDVDGQLSATIYYAGADDGDTAVAGNLTPVALNDSYLGTIGTPLAVSAQLGLLANDYDLLGESLEVAPDPVVLPAHGTLTLSGDGSFTYVPDVGYLGEDVFVYRISDPGTLSADAQVSLTIEPASVQNEPPVPTALAIQTAINTPGATRVQTGDPNPGDVHAFSLLAEDPTSPGAPGGPTNGSATVTPLGQVSYLPNLDYEGPDHLFVLVKETNTAELLEAWVRVDVNVVTNPPLSQDLGMQMTADTDPEDGDGDGLPFNDNVHLLLSAGDGFVTMGNGRPQYTFGFKNLSHLLPPLPPAVDPSNPLNIVNVSLQDLMREGTLGAEFPAPTIVFKQGQHVYLNLANVGMTMRPDLADPHSVHFHGFPNAASVFDGVPESSLAPNMMSKYTYFYNVQDPGTYLYHCHVEATEHMQMGMLGQLYVRPIQDETARRVAAAFPSAPAEFGGFRNFAYNDGDGSTGFHVEHAIQLSSFDPDFHDLHLNVQPLPFAQMIDRFAMINGRGYPDTIKPNVAPGLDTQKVGSLIDVAAGARVLLRISNVSITRFFTLASNLPMLVVGKDAKLLRNQRIAATTRVVNMPLPGVVVGAAADLSSAINAYGGLYLVFDSGPLAGLGRRILAYSGPGQIFLLESPLPTTALVGDSFHVEARADLSYTTQSLDLGGGMTADVIIDTQGITPGTYLLYTTNLNYLTNNDELDASRALGGMVTEIRIR